MAQIYNKVYFDGKVVDKESASLSVASSAVLYGLSVYTVFPILRIKDEFAIFRVDEHLKRLQNSAKLIGLSLPKECESENSLLQVVRDLTKENNLQENVFARATIHVNELVPGTKSRGMSVCFSIFFYEMKAIVPQDGVRLKTSPWRRNPDFCIPSRAKVNGAYVNSVLAKQDAIDSGYDDAVFLDLEGHVCELSAANIFLVKNEKLVTPASAADILEGINRKTIVEVAKDMGLEIEERVIDMTELYIAEEIFVCGTSAFVSFVKEIDGRVIGNGSEGAITKKLKEAIQKIQNGEREEYKKYIRII